MRHVAWTASALLLLVSCTDHAKSNGNGDAGSMNKADGGGADAGGTTGKMPDGWLYTEGGHVYLSHGNKPGTVWVGRGVNVDDIYFCGYNYMLKDAKPDDTLKAVLSGLISGWHPTFLRMSLSMGSFDATPASWTDAATAAQYQTPMTNVINSIGTSPNVYVLVTVRSHPSMILQDTTDNDAEATGLPSDADSTPDKTKFPTGTDATYIALVDTFAHSPFVLFGITNEPGGNKRDDATIAKIMDHAVSVIRKEEDKLGVPHHIVSVQGNGWTSNIQHYEQAPLPYDNVVYEVHGYPPLDSSYTYSSLPVIIGEYGTLPSGGEDAFFNDLEAKQLPSLAWDFDPYNNCSPDLVNVDHSAANLTPSDWGKVVKAYLAKHQ